MSFGEGCSSENYDSDAFIEWAHKHAVPISVPKNDKDFNDLQFFNAVLGSARIVAVGESAHYLREWNRWRARLFKYLVLEHGFTTFVLESALVEGRIVHDYVAGADHDHDTVAAAINNVWGVWTEINELIRWMRDWNSDPSKPFKLHFYGMDGTGNWSHAKNAYHAVLKYLVYVDQPHANSFARSLEKTVHEISFETRTEFPSHALRMAVGDAQLIVNQIEQARTVYIELSSRDDYDWALRSAQILRDVLLCLAQTDPDFKKGFREFWNVRDISMTESLHWILEREGFNTGTVIGAHNTHLQRYPLRTEKATSMGSYFANRFGRKTMLVVGAASSLSLKGDAPIAESNQATYSLVGPDSFFLDFRQAPKGGPVANWLAQERPDRSNLRYQPVCAGEAWDCILFHRTLSTATVEWPAFLYSPYATPPNNLDRFSGRYTIYGFLAVVNTLDVYYDKGGLFTDGQDDISGEIFPPYRAQIYYCEDSQFRWKVWPSLIAFEEINDGMKVSVKTPGGKTYHGYRTSDAKLK